MAAPVKDMKFLRILMGGELLQELDALVEKRGTTRSELVRRILWKEIRTLKKLQKTAV